MEPFSDILNTIEKNILEDVLISETEEENNNTKDDWDILRRQKKRTDKTLDNIFKEVEKLLIHPNVFENAVKYFNNTINFKNNKKLKMKKTIMCACIYLAYSIEGEHRCEINLMECFEVKKKKFTTALKLIKIAVPEVRKIGINIENQIYKICIILEITEDITSIKDFISKVICTSFVKTFSNDKNKKKKYIHFIILYTWLLINKKHLITPSKYANLTNVSKKDIIFIIKNCEEFTQFLIDNYIFRIKNTLLCIKNKFPKIDKKYFNVNDIAIAKDLQIIFCNIIKNKKKCYE